MDHVHEKWGGRLSVILLAISEDRGPHPTMYWDTGNLAGKHSLTLWAKTCPLPLYTSYWWGMFTTVVHTSTSFLNSSPVSPSLQPIFYTTLIKCARYTADRTEIKGKQKRKSYNFLYKIHWTISLEISRTTDPMYFLEHDGKWGKCVSCEIFETHHIRHSLYFLGSLVTLGRGV